MNLHHRLLLIFITFLTSCDEAGCGPKECQGSSFTYEKKSSLGYLLFERTNEKCTQDCSTVVKGGEVWDVDHFLIGIQEKFLYPCKVTSPAAPYRSCYLPQGIANGVNFYSTNKDTLHVVDLKANERFFIDLKIPKEERSKLLRLGKFPVYTPKLHIQNELLYLTYTDGTLDAEIPSKVKEFNPKTQVVSTIDSIFDQSITSFNDIYWTNGEKYAVKNMGGKKVLLFYESEGVIDSIEFAFNLSRAFDPDSVRLLLNSVKDSMELRIIDKNSASNQGYWYFDPHLQPIADSKRSIENGPLAIEVKENQLTIKVNDEVLEYGDYTTWDW